MLWVDNMRLFQAVLVILHRSLEPQGSPVLRIRGARRILGM
jgi:hypothetical protein